MMDFDERIKLCAFDGQTTNQNDYRIPPMEPRVKHRWPNNDPMQKIRRRDHEHFYTCPETLSKLRASEYVPANLTWVRRPILDPPVQNCGVSEDQLDPIKDEVIRSRPRVYMGAAVSIDDVPDPETRNLLLNYMYTTDFKRSFKEAQDYTQAEAKQKKSKAKNCKTFPTVVPSCDIQDKYVPMSTPENFPPLDGKIRKNYEQWDKKQLRACIDPTTKFWTKYYEHRKPGYDKPAASLIPNEIIDHLSCLIDSDKLRQSHDKIMCGYDGFVPDMAVGEVEKIQLPKEHPMYTTNQAVYINHFDHEHNNYEK